MYPHVYPVWLPDKIFPCLFLNCLSFSALTELHPLRCLTLVCFLLLKCHSRASLCHFHPSLFPTDPIFPASSTSILLFFSRGPEKTSNKSSSEIDSSEIPDLSRRVPCSANQNKLKSLPETTGWTGLEMHYSGQLKEITSSFLDNGIKKKYLKLKVFFKAVTGIDHNVSVII